MLRVSAVMLFALSAQAAALPCDPNTMPMPKRQADEIKLAPDASLEQACLASVNARSGLIGTHLGRPAFSHSPRWGDIVRMDIGKPDPGRYSRIVCVRSAGTAAVVMALYVFAKDFCDGHGMGITFYAPSKP